MQQSTEPCLEDLGCGSIEIGKFSKYSLDAVKGVSDIEMLGGLSGAGHLRGADGDQIIKCGELLQRWDMRAD